MRRTWTSMSATVLAIGGFTACEPVSPVACGQVLTQDTELTADVTGCAGDGLRIGADDLTVDLAGHTVSSTGGAGISLAGHDGVTIEGGTVAGGTIGLSLTDAEDLVVRHISASGPEAGVALVRVDGSRISSTVGAGYDSFRLDASHDNRIRFVSAREFPGLDNNTAITLRASHLNRVSDSDLGGGNDSIVLRDSDANVIADNDASNSNGYGIALQNSDHNVVRRNDTVSEAASIVVSSSTDNVLDGNRLGGGNPGTDIVIHLSPRTRLLRNRVELIEVRASADVVLTRNVVTGGEQNPEADGIVIFADSPGAQLVENQATDFSDDGLQVDGPGAVLRGNVANDNGDLGIEAVPGVIDGGHNRATGNGNPAQCLNVRCRPGT